MRWTPTIGQFDEGKPIINTLSKYTRGREISCDLSPFLSGAIENLVSFDVLAVRVLPIAIHRLVN